MNKQMSDARLSELEMLRQVGSDLTDWAVQEIERLKTVVKELEAEGEVAHALARTYIAQRDTAQQKVLHLQADIRALAKPSAKTE